MSQAAEVTDPKRPPAITGVVDQVGDGWVQVKLPGTDYRLRLVPDTGLSAGTAIRLGDKVAGIVRVQAQRMDVVPAGGRYIEPVQGRPRRVQGRVVGGSVDRNEVYVMAGPGVVVTPMSPQRAVDFSIGQMVSFDVKPGAILVLGSGV